MEVAQGVPSSVPFLALQRTLCRLAYPNEIWSPQERKNWNIESRQRWHQQPLIMNFMQPYRNVTQHHCIIATLKIITHEVQRGSFLIFCAVIMQLCWVAFLCCYKKSTVSGCRCHLYRTPRFDLFLSCWLLHSLFRLTRMRCAALVGMVHMMAHPASISYQIVA